MRKAAEIWAQARQQGQPTAGNNTQEIIQLMVTLFWSLKQLPWQTQV
jgi:hypothetical protein